MKLYLVTCRGMTYSASGSTVHGINYVVANNPDEAYKIVRELLDKQNIGFSHDRALHKVELIAEEGIYPECKTRLIVSPGECSA